MQAYAHTLLSRRQKSRSRLATLDTQPLTRTVSPLFALIQASNPKAYTHGLLDASRLALCLPNGRVAKIGLHTCLLTHMRVGRWSVCLRT